MLTELKKAMREQQQGSFVADAIMESNTSVKDLFLDEPDVALIGAENDPKIKGLIDRLPEYDEDGGDEIAEKVDALTESFSDALLEAALTSNSKLANPSPAESRERIGKLDSFINSMEDHLQRLRSEGKQGTQQYKDIADTLAEKRAERGEISHVQNHGVTAHKR